MIQNIKRAKSWVKFQIQNPYGKMLEKIEKEPPRILIGTYVHEYKDYSFNNWIKRAVEIGNAYPGDVDILIVDNSDNKEYALKLKNRIKPYQKEVLGIKNSNPLVFKGDISVLRLSKEYDNTREKQRASQQVLWDATLGQYPSLFDGKKYGYLFIIESDIYPPVNALIELLKYNKRICSGLYSLKNDETYEGHKKHLIKSKVLHKWKAEDIGDYMCVIPFKMRGDSKFLLHRKEIENIRLKAEETQWGHVFKIFACGLGVILIRRDVLEEVKPETTTRQQVAFYKSLLRFSKLQEKKYKYHDQYFVPYLERVANSYEDILNKKIHPDTNFHVLCDKAGISRFVNPYLECEHDRSDWKDVKFR